MIGTEAGNKTTNNMIYTKSLCRIFTTAYRINIAKRNETNGCNVGGKFVKKLLYNDSICCMLIFYHKLYFATNTLTNSFQKTSKKKGADLTSNRST